MCNTCDELRERVRTLEAHLFGDSWDVPEEFGLSVVQSKILATLVSRTRESSADLLFEASRGADASAEVLNGHLISVHIMKLRRKLAPYGLQIENVRARGYRLAPASRHRLLTWNKAAEDIAA